MTQPDYDHDDVRSATSFQIFTCGDPACGVHIMSFDEHEHLICQTVMSPEQMKVVISKFYDILRTHNR